MTVDRSRFVVGMEVVGAEGDAVGTVKDIRDADILVDRRMRRDVYIPFNAVAQADGRMVVLSVPADHVDDRGWEQPSPLPTRGEASGEGERDSIVTGTGDPAERGTWSPAADDYDLDPATTITGSHTEPGYASPEFDPAKELPADFDEH